MKINREEKSLELLVAKQNLGELQRRFFKGEISEDIFKAQKPIILERIDWLEKKLK